MTIPGIFRVSKPSASVWRLLPFIEIAPSGTAALLPAESHEPFTCFRFSGLQRGAARRNQFLATGRFKLHGFGNRDHSSTDRAQLPMLQDNRAAGFGIERSP